MKWHNDRQVWELRNDREAHNARRKARYGKDPAKGAADAKAWRDAHPEQYQAMATRAKEKYWASPWRKLIIAAKGRAEKRGLPFDLTFEWGLERWTGFCEVSGLPFVIARRSENNAHRMFSPSVDQIEPSQGYTQANSRFVLLAVNGFKFDGTDEAMYFIAQAIINHEPFTRTLNLECRT